MNFINDHRFKWQEQNNQEFTLFFKGKEEFALTALRLAQNQTDEENLIFTLKKHLKNQQDFTSGIIEMPNYTIAWVDHIRSWPIFYTQHNDNFLLSNNARELQENAKLTSVDPSSCLEFSMSGYVSGKRTLYTDLNCLQPGEFLVWNKSSHQLSLIRYYQYIPDMLNSNKSRNENKKKLGAILDNLTLKIIKRANGRPIWIPLSGGLDSRIILCKLHELGYKNIHSFTYGPKLNFEAKIAKKIAKKLNVPWIFISPSKSKIRSYFNSAERKEFWSSTDGLKAIPSMREFSALMNLRERKFVPDDAIFVNGQSGDYITGNHISKTWTEDKKFTSEDFFQILLKKHYDLWQSLNTQNNFTIIKNRIIELLPSDWKTAKNGIEWATLEEIWEYDARQICLVANGQRSYDFFGYDWEMPLWEKELVDFCETLPLDQKIGQSFYKEYLQDYNYKNLFPEKEPYIWRWPAPMLWVVPMAQIVHLIKDRKAKDNFYALMRYHGHYSNQFYSFPWKTHKRTYMDTRNVMSLNVREWIKENPSIFSKNITKELQTDHVD